MKKVKLATVWLDGCSGCHMSLLDSDAAVIALAGKIDMVYGPLVDAQEFPEAVDVTLVEGAVSSLEDMSSSRTFACARIYWSRWEIARSPAMFLLCATRSR